MIAYCVTMGNYIIYVYKVLVRDGEAEADHLGLPLEDPARGHAGLQDRGGARPVARARRLQHIIVYLIIMCYNIL